MTTTDGTIWVLGKSGRPAAMAGIFYYRSANGMEKWSCELLSLSDEPLSLTGKSGWTWTPEKSEVAWSPLPTAPAPQETPRARDLQLRNIARTFNMTEFINKRPEPLRLMNRAIHRYSDPGRGIIDGAVFAFASGTNPEGLLLLECRQEKEAKSWHYAFARMTAAPAEARLENEVVWECDGIGPWIPTAPYYSEFGYENDVFGNGTPGANRRFQPQIREALSN